MAKKNEEELFDDLSDVEEEVKVEVDLKLVSKLVDKLIAIDDQILDLKEKLAEVNEARDSLAREGIPTAMVGLRKVVTLSGDSIEVKPKSHVRLLKKKEENFFSFLRKNKEDAIIKENLAITELTSGTLESLFKELSGKYGERYAISLLRSIHPQTLKAYITRKKEGGEEFPEDCFNIFEYDEAIVKKKRRKKNANKKEK